MSKHSARSSPRVFALPAARYSKTVYAISGGGAPGCNSCTLIAHAIALRERKRQPQLSRVFSFTASTYGAADRPLRYGRGLLRPIPLKRKRRVKVTMSLMYLGETGGLSLARMLQRQRMDARPRLG